jgi:hypothetical protein
VQLTIYHDKEMTNFERYTKLRIGDSIPIVYDPLSPSRSDLNFEDKIHTTDPFANIFPLDIFPLGLFIIIWIILMFIFFPIYYKQKNLVKRGRVAAATIIDEKEVRSQFGVAATLTYRFTDTDGKIVQGIRQRLPSKTARRSGYRLTRFWDDRIAVWAAARNNPTVVYDPRNSTKNMLYPVDWVDCYLPRHYSIDVALTGFTGNPTPRLESTKTKAKPEAAEQHVGDKATGLDDLQRRLNREGSILRSKILAVLGTGVLGVAACFLGGTVFELVSNCIEVRYFV